MSRMSTFPGEFTKTQKRIGVYIVFAVIILYRLIHEILNILVGHQLFSDARLIWRPFASAVASGGIPYIAVWDNKPPFFHLINFISYISGSYAVVWMCLLALSHFLTAILMYKFLQKHDTKPFAFTAVLFFLLSLSLFRGFQINPRPVSNLFIMFSLLTTNPILIGISFSLSGLLSQFAILGLPVGVYYHHKYTSLNVSLTTLTKICISGLMTATLFYGLLVTFSVSAMKAAVVNSLLAALPYSLPIEVVRFGTPPKWAIEHPSLYTNPAQWAIGMYKTVQHRTLVLGLAFVGCLTSYYYKRRIIRLVSVGLIASFSLQLLIRAAGVYFILLLPWLSILSISGVRDLLLFD